MLSPLQPLPYAAQHKQQALVSPEMLNALKAKDMRMKYDEFLSDVFSLGMTMLQVASLRPSSTFYDWKNFEIKWDKMEDALTGLLANYSGDFVGYLRTMLSREPAHRPGFQEIYNMTESPLIGDSHTYIPPVEQHPHLQQEQPQETY